MNKGMEHPNIQFMSTLVVIEKRTFEAMVGQLGSVRHTSSKLWHTLSEGLLLTANHNFGDPLAFQGYRPRADNGIHVLGDHLANLCRSQDDDDKQGETQHGRSRRCKPDLSPARFTCCANERSLRNGLARHASPNTSPRSTGMTNATTTTKTTRSRTTLDPSRTLGLSGGVRDKSRAFRPNSEREKQWRLAFRQRAFTTCSSR